MDNASPDEYYDHAGSDGESADDDQQLKQESPGTSPTGFLSTADRNALPLKPHSHLQKRRRVTRACDECRRKKIKCDGKQPCTHCTVYSYDCTYDQPSNRRRNPAPQYVENLEHRVHRAETLLHILIPNLDLNDPGIDAAVAQGWIPGAPGKGDPTAATDHRIPRSAPPPGDETKSDTNIESMVRAVAQLDMDETGHWDYHGHSSGLSFVRRMREQLGDLMGPDTMATPFVKNRPLSQVVDSPKSMAESPIHGSDASPTSGVDLPPKAFAQELCNYAIDDAAALLRVFHRPTFFRAFEHLYNTSPENYTNEDQKFLPLLFSTLALGHLFRRDEQNDQSDDSYERAIQQGFMYFKTARTLMDIADCRDLMSLQAIVLMILFLQSSAKLSQCYAYVGVALRSALRMGLHRSHVGNFNPIEAETRKRIFWIVRKQDVYVGAMLGLPQTLSDEDIDQDFPLEVDDEYVTEDGILPMPEGQVSLMTAFNAHTRLVQILQKIMRYVYPINVPGQGKNGDKSYSVTYSIIREIEGDLEKWQKSLPPILNPCPAPARYTRVQQLLRLSYAHAQVMLYRPFLHFVAMEKRSKPIDDRAYACAATYVIVSRNIIHIQTHMMQRGLLNGAFWFIQYTSFFAILSLVYFAAENPDNVTTEGVMKDALEGKQVLASLAKRSMAADRCTATLNIIFQRLPDWMRNGQQNPTVSRKRQFEQSALVQQPNGVRSNTDVSESGSNEPVPLHKRASTYPRSGPSVNAYGNSPATFETWSPTVTSPMGPLTPTTGEFNPSGYMNYNNQPGVTGPMNQNVPYTILPNNYPNPALTDISIHFPGADEPFAYPTQPLTAFENNQQFAAKGNNGPYTTTATTQSFRGGVDDTSPLTAPPPSRGGGREDNMEAQFFALPPYIEQRQHLHQQEQQQAPQHPRQQQMGYPNAKAGATNFPNGASQQAPLETPTTQQLSNDGGWPGLRASAMQAGGGNGMGGEVGNINIQDIFGGTEWNSMLMTGYQQ